MTPYRAQLCAAMAGEGPAPETYCHEPLDGEGSPPRPSGRVKVQKFRPCAPLPPSGRLEKMANGDKQGRWP